MQGSSLIYYVEVFLSVLFLGYVAARKKNIFASQIKERRYAGRCPEPQSLFEKSDAKTFILWG